MHLNAFGIPDHESDRDRAAAYAGRCADNERYFGMALVSPKDPVASVNSRITANRLIGYKPYPDFVDWKRATEITVRLAYPPFAGIPGCVLPDPVAPDPSRHHHGRGLRAGRARGSDHG